MGRILDYSYFRKPTGQGTDKTIGNPSAVACKPSYTLGQVRVSGGRVTPLLERDHRPLGGDITWLIMLGLRTSRTPKSLQFPPRYNSQGFIRSNIVEDESEDEIWVGFKLLGRTIPAAENLTTDDMIAALTAFIALIPRW
jgi:hypothetical protein